MSVSDEELRNGREALAECYAAYIGADDLRGLREDDAQLAEKLCQHTARNYKAVHDGWPPIRRCWPLAAKIDNSVSWAEDFADLDFYSAFAALGLRAAKTTLWNCALLGGHTYGLVKAWSNWDDVYVPEPIRCSIVVKNPAGMRWTPFFVPENGLFL